MLMKRCYFLKFCFDSNREASVAKIQKKIKVVEILKFDDETDFFD